MLFHLTPYAILAILPIAAFLSYSFNPAQFSWSFRHGLEPMPTEVRDRATAIQPVCAVLADVLVLGLVGVAMLGRSVGPAQVGLLLDRWTRNALLGLAAAVALAALQGIVAKRVTIGPGQFVEIAKKRPISISVSMFLVGAFSEELWIALCIVALRAAGHTAFTSAVITSVVFAVAHYQPSLSSALGVALKGGISTSLFISTGSLVATFSWHFVGNLGSLYIARRRLLEGGWSTLEP
jgi:membrane protease YdiL (CAAX protease family)